MKINDMKWEILEQKQIYSCPIFDLYETRRKTPGGKEGPFVLMKTPHWVSVVPVLEEGVFLMVRQYRLGIDRMTLEFPAGLNDPGESPEKTARRELAEETGFVPGELKKSGEFAPVPAFMDNRIHYFVARNLEDRGLRHLDEFEDIEVVRMKEKDLIEGFGSGELINPQTFTAYHLYKRLSV